MILRWAILLLLAALLVVPLACTPRRDEPLVGRLPLRDPQVRLGEKVYAWNCYECHPGGHGAVGFSINGKPLPGPMIKTQVRVGAGAMPAFSKERISDEELDATVKYLVALRKAGK